MHHGARGGAGDGHRGEVCGRPRGAQLPDGGDGPASADLLRDYLRSDESLNQVKLELKMARSPGAPKRMLQRSGRGARCGERLGKSTNKDLQWLSVDQTVRDKVFAN